MGQQRPSLTTSWRCDTCPMSDTFISLRRILKAFVMLLAEACRTRWCALMGACLCTALLAWVPAASAANLVQAQAYWVDTSGQADLQVAQQQRLQPFDGMLSLGFSEHPTWVRLRIGPGPGLLYPSNGAHWTLRLRPSYLDDVALYDPLLMNRGEAMPWRSGDRHPWGQYGYRSINHGFVIPASGQPRDIWLRLQSTSSHLMMVEVLAASDLQAQDRQQDVLYLILITLQAVFLVWALIGWISGRDRLMGWFVLKQVWMLPYLFFINGYPRLIWTDDGGGDLVAQTAKAEALHQLTNLVILCYTSTSYWFDTRLVRSSQPARWANGLLLLPMLLFPLAFLALASGQTRLAMELNIHAVTLGPLMAIVAVLGIDRSVSGAQLAIVPGLSKWALLAYYLVAMVPLLLTVLPILGWIDTGSHALSALYVHATLAGFVLMVLLQLRARSTDQARVQALQRLAVSEERAALQQQRREETSQFFAMLTHELRTPLAVIKMVLPLLDSNDAVGKAPRPTGARQSRRESPQLHIERAVQDIDNLIERCVHTERVDAQTVQAKSQPCDLFAALKEAMNRIPHAHRCRLDSRLAEAPVKSDPRLLDLVFSNLLDNALRYSPAASAVSIQVQWDAPSQCYVLKICNAMAHAQALDPERIFNKYHRNPEARRSSGAGLGLYLVRALVGILGGSIDCVPSAPQSACFVLKVPKT